MGIAVQATHLRLSEEKQPFGGPGPDKAKRQEKPRCASHVNTHQPQTHVCTPAKLQHCYGNVFTKGIAAASLALPSRGTLLQERLQLPPQLPSACKASLEPICCSTLVSARDSTSSHPSTPVGIGVVSVGPTSGPSLSLSLADHLSV